MTDILPDEMTIRPDANVAMVKHVLNPRTQDDISDAHWWSIDYFSNFYLHPERNYPGATALTPEELQRNEQQVQRELDAEKHRQEEAYAQLVNRLVQLAHGEQIPTYATILGRPSINEETFRATIEAAEKTSQLADPDIANEVLGTFRDQPSRVFRYLYSIGQQYPQFTLEYFKKIAIMVSVNAGIQETSSIGNYTYEFLSSFIHTLEAMDANVLEENTANIRTIVNQMNAVFETNGGYRNDYASHAALVVDGHLLKREDVLGTVAPILDRCAAVAPGVFKQNNYPVKETGTA